MEVLHCCRWGGGLRGVYYLLRVGLSVDMSQTYCLRHFGLRLLFDRGGLIGQNDNNSVLLCGL